MTINEADSDADSPAPVRQAPAVARAQAGLESGAAAGEQQAPPAAAPQRGARWLATLALLCALAALAGVGWLYWQRTYEPDPLAQRLADVEQRLAVVPQAPSLDLSVVRREVERAATELRQSLEAEWRAQVPQSLSDASDRAHQEPLRARDWQLAEVRYLLRMANHRLLLERDAAGAALLLAAADAVLVELDDFGLHPVRAQIAAERLALESLPVLDAEGLFLQLEAIKRELERLPLRLPTLQPAPPAAAPKSGWDAVRAEVVQLVRFRRLEGAAARPLLAPEEAVYLELNLRLMLERAQLAGLRGEQGVYEQSIAAARDWIERSLDVSTPVVQRVLEGLRALQAVTLAAPLPDISGSLEALQSLQSPADPAPPDPTDRSAGPEPAP